MEDDKVRRDWSIASTTFSKECLISSNLALQVKFRRIVNTASGRGFPENISVYPPQQKRKRRCVGVPGLVASPSFIRNTTGVTPQKLRFRMPQLFWGHSTAHRLIKSPDFFRHFALPRLPAHQFLWDDCLQSLLCAHGINLVFVLCCVVCVACCISRSCSLLCMAEPPPRRPAVGTLGIAGLENQSISPPILIFLGTRTRTRTRAHTIPIGKSQSCGLNWIRSCALKAGLRQ
jgi:hypothetical protein